MDNNKEHRKLRFISSVLMLTICQTAVLLYAETICDRDSAFYYSIIENGFPAQAIYRMGGPHSGPSICTVVADIKGDSCKEIVITGYGMGPLYCYDHYGAVLSGWPVEMTQGGAVYPCVIDRKVIACGYRGDIMCIDSLGDVLWQKTAANYIATPPSAAYLISQGGTYFFTEEEDWSLHGYSTTAGSSFASWPYHGGNGQNWLTPAVADIDLDGQCEIVSVNGGTDTRLIALSESGNVKPGWDSITVYSTTADNFPVVGDVDGDGALEVVVVANDSGYPWPMNPKIFDAYGQLKRSWFLGGWGKSVALGDLNSDGTPEIVLQCEDSIFVCNGLGETMFGWPKGGLGDDGNSAPAIGDVDGDNNPDVVCIGYESLTGDTGYVHAFSADGEYIPGFPIKLRMGAGAAPAIADIDMDHHNEIIISSSYWHDSLGTCDKVWAFDLDRDSTGVTHGRIEWGQFMHDERHSGFYGPPATGVAYMPSVPKPAKPMLACWPNPSRGNFNIRFECRPGSEVDVAVYDATGRLADRLYRGNLPDDSRQFRWNGAKHAGGIYFCRASTGKASTVVKLVNIK